MALHKDFPTDPHTMLDPAIRWFPANEALREIAELGTYAAKSNILPAQTLGRPETTQGCGRCTLVGLRNM